MKKSILAVFGTRPEAIKVAPVLKALRAHGGFEVTVAVTAQHRRMLDEVLRLFEIVPEFDLDIMTPGQTLSSIVAKSLTGLESVILTRRPDMVMVQGDTTTTLAAALAAFYHQIPVAHIEAGLRTHDRYNPFPEELNRRLAGTLSTIHLPPTESAKANLAAEGITENVFVTGNTVIDALISTLAKPFTWHDELGTLLAKHERWLLVTAHRRESWGREMDQIAEALAQVAFAYPELGILFPIHLNPIVRRSFANLDSLENLHQVEPVDYQTFAHLMAAAYLVLTDSGGIQEEAPHLGKPVVVCRRTTERPEGVAAGTVRLAGTEARDIFAALTSLLADDSQYESMARAINPYGDGCAAARIVQAVAWRFGMVSNPPPPFVAPAPSMAVPGQDRPVSPDYVAG